MTWDASAGTATDGDPARWVAMQISIITPRASRARGERGGAARAVPGILVAGACAGLILLAAWRIGPPFNPLLVGILVGVAIGNLVRLPEVLEPGLQAAGRRLLRIGVVLLGLQVPLGAVLATGPGVLVLVTLVVGMGVVGTLALGRLLGVGWRQRVLIACGFSICGASAVAGAGQVVDAEDEEVVTAVALVVLWGTLMIPTVPLLGQALGLSVAQQSVLVGASLHEVAQVVVAGSALGGAALGLAVLVKLARVLLLAPVLACLTLWQRRQHTSAAAHPPAVVPLFVVVFLLACVLRTTDVLPPPVLTGAQAVQTVLFTTAMVGLGTSVRWRRLLRLGWRLWVLAAAGTALVLGVALIGVHVVG